MDDLESAIMQDSAPIDAATNNADEVEVSSPSPPPAIEQSEVDKEADCATADRSLLSSFWPPKEDEFVIALLQDGFYIGHVREIRGDQLYLNFLAPELNKTASDRQYWTWPDSEKDSDWIDRDCIMEIYPSIRIERKSRRKLSTRRKIVYELMNLEIVNVMLQYC